MPVLYTQRASDSQRHPQPELLKAAEALVMGYLRLKRASSLAALRRTLLPTNTGLLLSAIDRLVGRGVLHAKPGVDDVIIELAGDREREVQR